MGSYVFMAARTLATVVIGASVWPFVADAYDGMVVRLAHGFLPTDIVARAGESRIYLDFLDGVNGAGLGVDGYLLAFGLILASALVLSTPGLGLVRAVAWESGILALFLAVHVAGLTLFVWGLHAATQGQSEVTMGQVMTAFAVFWALLPAVVGGAWCYWRWLPALRSPGRKDGVPSGNAPVGH